MEEFRTVSVPTTTLQNPKNTDVLKSSHLQPLNLHGNSSYQNQPIPVQVRKYTMNEIQVVHRRSGNIENVSPITKPAVFPEIVETTFIGSPHRQKHNSEPIKILLAKPASTVVGNKMRFPSTPSFNHGYGCTAGKGRIIADNHAALYSRSKSDCLNCGALQRQVAKAEADVVILKDILHSSDIELVKLRHQLAEATARNNQLNAERSQILIGLQGLAQCVTASVFDEKNLSRILASPHSEESLHQESPSKSIESSLEKIASLTRRPSIGRSKPLPIEVSTLFRETSRT